MRAWSAITAAVMLVCGLSACGGSAEDAYRRSVAAFRAEDYSAAAAAAHRAVEADPGHVKAWFLLGRAHSALGQWDQAIDAYRHAIELDPRHAKALHNLGNVYFRRGQHEEAAVWYRRAIDVDPRYALGLFNYGWVLRQLNRPAEAEAAFRRCLEIEPDSPRDRKIRLDCLYYLGTIRFRERDYAAAASIMEQVVRLNPGHVEARYYLGMAYRHLDRLDDAQRELAIHKRMLRAVRPETVEIEEDP